MSTSEPKKDAVPVSESAGEPNAAERAREADQNTETAAPPQPDAAPAASKADEPVWPPLESQPTDTPDDQPAAPPADDAAVLTKLDEPAEAKLDEPAAAKPDEPTAAKPDEPAAEPKQEMALSESTLHWMVDGEVPIEPSEAHPTIAPIYDLQAPVAGRRRTSVLVGGAAILALVVAWALHAQAARHHATVQTPTVETAGLLDRRAEAALAAGRSAEALDLARLAIVTDPGFADAYIVIGAVQQSNGQLIDARDSYRRYLELAPLGTHAAEARGALTSLPP
jgi:tetratricopeptide (TPR) repeat protein